jgi:hypothetical protein
LLAVAKSGVEDADVLGVRDAVGAVTWAAPSGRLCCCWRQWRVMLVGIGDDGFSGAGLGERREGLGGAMAGLNLVRDGRERKKKE